MKEVMNTPEGYKKVVTHSDEYISEYNKHNIYQKCIFLRRAYIIALEKMGTGTNWLYNKKDNVSCCEQAVKQLNELGFDATTCAKTLSMWNVNFRKLAKFPHPDPYVANGLKRKPPIFDFFPEAVADATTFILEHQSNFGIDMLRKEFIDNISKL